MVELDQRQVEGGRGQHGRRGEDVARQRPSCDGDQRE